MAGSLSPQPARVVAVGDHPLVLAGLARVLDSMPDFSLSGAFTNTGFGLREVARLAPELVIVDLNLGHTGVLELCSKIQEVAPATVVLILSDRREPVIELGGRDAGVARVVDRSIGLVPLVLAIRSAIVNSRPDGRDLLPTPRSRRVPALPLRRLSPRQQDVVRLMSEGLTYREIAVALGLAPNTVRAYQQAVLGRLSSRNRIEAVRAAQEEGLI